MLYTVILLETLGKMHIPNQAIRQLQIALSAEFMQVTNLCCYVIIMTQDVLPCFAYALKS